MKDRKDKVALQWILRVSGRKLWWPALLTALRIVQGYLYVLYAYLLKNVVDQAAAGVSDGFYQQLGRFVVLVVVSVCLRFFTRYIQEKGKAELETAFRLRLFSQLLRRDYAQVTKTHTGEWMNRITSDATVVADAAATVVPETVGAIARVIGAFVSLLQLAPQIVYVILPAGMLMVIASYFIRKHLKRHHKNMQKTDGQARSFIQERLASLLVVRTFTQEAASETMAKEHMGRYVFSRMRRYRFVNSSYVALDAALCGAEVLGVGLCGWGILNGAITYGTMSSVLYLIGLVEAPFANASGYLAQYYSMIASAERLMEVEDFEPDTTKEPVSAETVRRYYEEEFASAGLENALFAYEDDQNNAVLRNFNLDIKKGQFVAFTGESGCGKSTTLKVLLSLYPLQSGQAYLRDRKGNKQELNASWRGMFAYVPQGNQLISGTVRQTLTFDDPDLMKQEKRIQKALEIACADQFVAELPQGLDTVLGERGSGLSEGQMQRLSLARAILSERPILLLDEATSALDAVTEERLLENLRSMTNRTVLIITHREAVLDFCDQHIHFAKE